MRFDLHVHTRAGSEDATLDPLVAAERLQALGYAGFALTEHNRPWAAADLAALRRSTPLVVIAGVEVQTEEVGHVLVYGWDEEPLWRYHRLERLVAAVRRKRAVAVAAHPLRRWFPPWLGGRAQGDPAEVEALVPWLRQLNGVEVLNGRGCPEENRLAAALAGRLGGLTLARSDAHAESDLGRAATLLPTASSPEEAVAALQNGLGRVEG